MFGVIEVPPAPYNEGFPQDECDNVVKSVSDRLNHPIFATI